MTSDIVSATLPGNTVRPILSAAESADGVAAFSEAFERGLDDDSLNHTHLIVEKSGAPVAVAGIAPDGSVEMAVHPEHRRAGHGRELVEAARERNTDAGFWAHGDLPAAQELAAAFGMKKVRELLVMGTVLDDDTAHTEHTIVAKSSSRLASESAAAPENAGAEMRMAATWSITATARSCTRAGRNRTQRLSTAGCVVAQNTAAMVSAAATSDASSDATDRSAPSSTTATMPMSTSHTVDSAPEATKNHPHRPVDAPHERCTRNVSHADSAGPPGTLSWHLGGPSTECSTS